MHKLDSGALVFPCSFHSREGRRGPFELEAGFDLGGLDPSAGREPARWLEARGWARPEWLDRHAEPVFSLEREGADGAFELVESDAHEPLADGARFRVPAAGGVYRISVWWTAVYVQASEAVGLWSERESARVPFLPSAQALGEPRDGCRGRVLRADRSARAGAIVWVTSARGAPRVGALVADLHGRFATGPVNVRELLIACECSDGVASARVDAVSATAVELVLDR
ncbi:MAG: hypothetical protein EPO68_10290 [Planctomycetota bacterium]|nr:MAG: hypothetical protein EPO68_10290 [Planctomycetota bacterium]